MVSVVAAAQPVYKYPEDERYVRASISGFVSLHQALDREMAASQEPLASAFSFTSSAASKPLPYLPRQSKDVIRTAAGEVWEDNTLNGEPKLPTLTRSRVADWPDNDYRLFVGDLGKEVSTEHLTQAFSHYKSFAKAKVSAPTSYRISDQVLVSRSFVIAMTIGQSEQSIILLFFLKFYFRGYGFVSFLDPMDCAKALREMNGKYLQSRCRYFNLAIC